MNIEIANRLVWLRKQNNLSQEELAAKLGISRQAVSKWERAESSPDTDNLILLARLYQVSLDDLLRTDGPVGANEGGTPVQTPEPNPPAAEQAENRQEWWKRYALSRALAGCYPILMTAIFLALGFCVDGWGWAWLVYLTIPVFYAGASDGFAMLAVILFLVLGLLLHAWWWAWLVLLSIPIFYVVREIARKNAA